MMKTPFVKLVERRCLDPRPIAEAAADPIADAVNVPFEELSERVVELPPRGMVIPVVGPTELAARTVDWLVQNGRRAVVEARNMRVGEAGRTQPMSEADEIGRLWRPTAFLAEILPSLPLGDALDLACGTGRDAVFMAACGWRVTGIDLLPDAIELARGLECRYAPGCAPIHWRVADIEGAPSSLNGSYDLITCFRFLHRPLLQALHRFVRPGGSVIIETFTTLHRQRHGKPGRDAFVLRPGELPTLLDNMSIRRFEESWRDDCHSARAWAESEFST